MPGLTCHILFYYNNTDIDNLFGYFCCRIETPLNIYLGLLPIRTRNGLTLPLGKLYISEELKFAKAHGYKIKVFKDYTFNREKDVFTAYINKVYDIKSKSTNRSQKAMAKSSLNNILGRFGINLEKPITKIVSEDTFERKSLINKIVSYEEITGGQYLVTFIPKLDYDIINSHGLDFLKVLSKYKDNEVQYVSNTSVVISAAVTAYARIHISKIKLHILHKGGDIIYSDTDSIVTNMKLPENMVSSSEIGKLKLEHKVKIGYFVTNKTYCILNDKDEYKAIAKGFTPQSINITDYEKLYKGESIYTGVRSEAQINWSKCEVRITDRENMLLSSDSYTKREKIYMDNRWVDTKPKVIDNLSSNNSTVLNYGKTKSQVSNNTKKAYHTISFREININYFDRDLVIYKRPPLDLIIYEPSVLDLVIYEVSYLDLVLFGYIKPVRSKYIFKDNNLIHSDHSLYFIYKENIAKLSSILSLCYYYIVTYLPFISIFCLYLISFLFQDEYPNENGEMLATELEVLDDIIVQKEKPEILETIKISIWEQDEESNYTDYNKELYTPNESVKSNDVEDYSNKYIGLEDIRYLFEDCVPDKQTSLDNNSPTNTDIKNNDNHPPFTPFTPNTLDTLNSEISKTDQAIKYITSKIDKNELAGQDKRKLSALLEEQQYYINQHKNHIESVNAKDQESLSNIEEKYKMADELENQIKELKENINKYKEKLNKDIEKNNYDFKEEAKTDYLDNTRKISDGRWKEGLNQQEIQSIENIDNKNVREMVKNRIDFENGNKNK